MSVGYSSLYMADIRPPVTHGPCLGPKELGRGANHRVGASRASRAGGDWLKMLKHYLLNGIEILGRYGIERNPQ